MAYIKFIFKFFYISIIYYIIIIIKYIFKKFEIKKYYTIHFIEKIFKNKKLNFYIFFISKYKLNIFY